MREMSPDEFITVDGGPLDGMTVSVAWANAIIRDPFFGPGYMLGFNGDPEHPWEWEQWTLEYSERLKNMQCPKDPS